MPGSDTVWLTPLARLAGRPEPRRSAGPLVRGDQPRPPRHGRRPGRRVRRGRRRTSVTRVPGGPSTDLVASPPPLEPVAARGPGAQVRGRSPRRCSHRGAERTYALQAWSRVVPLWSGCWGPTPRSGGRSCATYSTPRSRSGPPTGQGGDGGLGCPAARTARTRTGSGPAAPSSPADFDRSEWQEGASPGRRPASRSTSFASSASTRPRASPGGRCSWSAPTRGGSHAGSRTGRARSRRASTVGPWPTGPISESTCPRSSSGWSPSASTTAAGTARSRAGRCARRSTRRSTCWRGSWSTNGRATPPPETARRSGEEYLLERRLFRRLSTGEPAEAVSVLRSSQPVALRPAAGARPLPRGLGADRDDPDPRLGEAIEHVRSPAPGGRDVGARLEPAGPCLVRGRRRRGPAVSLGHAQGGARPGVGGRRLKQPGHAPSSRSIAGASPRATAPYALPQGRLLRGRRRRSRTGSDVEAERKPAFSTVVGRRR